MHARTEHVRTDGASVGRAKVRRVSVKGKKKTRGEGISLMIYFSLSLLFFTSRASRVCHARASGTPLSTPLLHTYYTNLRPPLDQRNFKGKVEDTHSYGFEHCSIIWNTGLRHRRSKGFFPMLLVSQGKTKDS